MKTNGLGGTVRQTPVMGAEIGWELAYERRMRKFNLAVILAALIALMVLIASLACL